MSVTAEVRRMIWESIAEYHETIVLRCKEMAGLDKTESNVCALATEIHGSMAAFARAALEKEQAK